ncbi:Metallo-dependent phosphatase [Basidiobolus meristosporus CBS 931.73]|uniref:Metallo-dependent phosphatase n=1 Tax=Basidiobolus meristosporus CBS 931.73 TaxID=1314790 RepID=A0A1Y1YG17_9FUNG|nr:Metallo-dependent phosphatase [Basidiobolus meristosporus CBS 931.73]|eukprot:ORX96833.1 Metallo-dependent phosphatase [Basidiobolus meristosporus CBS 931.73]
MRCFLLLSNLWLLAISASAQVVQETNAAYAHRTVAIGDIHSDYKNALSVLRMAAVVDANGDWIMGTNTLVQTGDIVDRGPDTILLYKYFQKLRAQAAAAGGNVVNLFGNHEIMNIKGDWRYVTKEEIATFGGTTARKEAWNVSTGWIGQFLQSSFNITFIQRGHTVFTHGDLHPTWAKKGAASMNALVHANLNAGKYDDPIFKTQGPVWWRGYGGLEDGDDDITLEQACAMVKEVTDTLKVKRLVSGHTQQSSTGRILSRCNNAYLDIDVGISSYYGSHFAALEILDLDDGSQNVAAIYPTGKVTISQ